MASNLWLIAILVALLVGAGASAYLWLVRRRQLEAAAGIRALAGMHRREFSHFAIDAMKHRGYMIAPEQETLARGLQSDFVLQRDGLRWLLSCRHGAARIGAATIAEMVATMAMNGAIDGLLATTCEIEAGARKAARQARIKLVAGATLWNETAPLLPESLREDVRAGADHRSRRMIGFAWFGAIVLGATTMLLMDRIPGNLAPEAPTTATATAPRATSEPQPVTVAPVETTPATPPAVVADPVPDDPLQEERDRNQIARMVSDVPGIDRAVWASRSTLLVHLQAGADVEDSTADICALLGRHETLATSRLQLQPPPGSEQMVRFHLCRQGL